MPRNLLFRSFILFTAATLLADGPADNLAEKVRPVPPPGQAIAEADREELARGVDQLARAIEQLPKESAPLVPDVQIFHHAVHYALKYNEIFHATNEVRAAKELLRLGLERAAQLGEGKPEWSSATGLVVRGYVSRIDGSIQPYGLVVPAGFSTAPSLPRRLDAWFHGRDEKLTELNFLTGRLRSPGEFVPEDGIVLHLYGRYCNANKFAGEIDLLEALEDVKRKYRIDEDRIVVRGFSMGGAACWQFAVHYPGKWAAAAPGAGFAETAEFLRVFQNEAVQPPTWEQKLWRWYDCPEYAVNLYNLPTVAYSGEIDKQKQAADIMAKALTEEGIELTHIIGPQTGHKYHPEAKAEINRRIDSIARAGRNPIPREVRFQTHTLRYNESFWVRIDGLEEHWEAARVEARIMDGSTIQVKARNVSAFTLSMPAGLCPLEPTQRPVVIINDTSVNAERVQSDRSWSSHFRLENGGWTRTAEFTPDGLRKSHGLQGPIDDAFMDSFIFVLPSGKAMNEQIGSWVEAEQQHAIEHWRKQFRGEARVIRDSDVTDEHIRDANLVLWGDPQSNGVLGRIARDLPITWTKDVAAVGQNKTAAATHVPVLIYPNPLNPQRYVVLNSGFTFREYDYLNNARQVAKLPDWAVIDTSTPRNSRYPGKVVSAGFFDEQWRVK